MNTLRLGHHLVGLGTWLATPPKRRMPWHALNTLALGRMVIDKLNAQYQTDEIARRHAKPSSRKRVG